MFRKLLSGNYFMANVMDLMFYENLVILIEYPRTNRLTASHGDFSRFINEVSVKSILYSVFHGKVHSLTLF